MRRKSRGKCKWYALLPARSTGFFLAFALFGALSLPGQAQQIPNLTADQLMQLQQQYGQRGNSGGNGVNDQVQPDVVLHPDLPQQKVQLPPSRLESILSQRAGAKLRQFGYDDFGSGRSVTISQSGAVQDDYVLGPGDEIVVTLRGQENSEFRTTVGRDGQVVLPRLSPISATGRSFGSFRQDVEAAVRRAYVATNAFVSIGRVRQISVLVSGEVNNPGQRILSGLSSAVDAILLAGGVKKTGSLRNIRIQRGGHTYVVDLYSVLTAGGGTTNLRLADGDRILVPLLGRTVAVSGLVRQPGIYELPASQSSIPVRTLLNLAGGQEVRGRYRLSVLRILPDGRSDMVGLTGETGVVRDSEILFVQLGADQTTGQAVLSGNIGLAGQYPIVPGTKLSDVLRAPGALGTAPYSLFGIVSRKDPHTLLRTLSAFTPVAVVSGTEDESLQGDDIVRPFSVKEMRLINSTVHAYEQQQETTEAAIRNPLAQDSSGLLNQNRTPTDNAYSQEADIRDIGSRSQYVLDAVASGTPLAQAKADERRLMEPGRPMQQPDNLQQDASQQYPSQQNQQQNQLQQNQLQQNGAGNQQQGGLGYGRGVPVNPQMPDYQQNTGSYGPEYDADLQSPQQKETSPAANFEDQRVNPESFPTNRQPRTFDDLAQQLGVDPLVLVNFLLDHQVTIDGAVRGPGTYLVGPDVALKDLIQSAGGTGDWTDESGVELISTAVDTENGQSETRRVNLPLNKGMLASYIVRPHDEFRFSQTFVNTDIGSVTVQGEIRFAGTYHIMRGEHLSDLLARAGGLTSTAYPYGTVFLRKSAAEQERASYVRAATQIEDELVVAMTRVGTDKISPDTFSAMQAFVTDLRNQKAEGRIAIQADPSVLAAKPELDPLLEAGDVIYIPQRPSTIAVLGQVMQPGSFPYRAGETLGEYVAQAGGYSTLADDSETYIVLPDGTARKVEKSWLSFDVNTLPPGSAIVVPRDVTPLDLRQTIIDVSQIFSQLAVSIASVAVISKQ